jgi:hypothetical protein
MTLLASILHQAEATHPLIMPNFAFAAIAFGIFLALGVVTWTYRDVANRHANKANAQVPGAHDDHQHGSGH